MTSRMCLKTGRSAGNGEYSRKGTTSRVIAVSKAKVSSWPDGKTIPENYRLLFVYTTYTYRELEGTIEKFIGKS
jgi:hypothetical protein